MSLPIEMLRIGMNAVGRVQALTAEVAINNGQWILVSGYTTKTVHVSGITTGTVIISGSNEDAPADSTHGIALATLTANGMTTVVNACRWLKVRVSAWTTGAFDAWVEVCS